MRRPLAHAIAVRRITVTALRRAMRLTGFCERCGATTQHVCFYSDGVVVEACAVCRGEAGAVGEAR